MIDGAALPHRLERSLARLLQGGTILASAVIALGLAAVPLLSPEMGGAGWRVATAGIVVFILLPVARVAAMLLFFLRSGDYEFGAIAALVMSIMLLSFFLGAN
jgi:uncharacterized membrane protein